MRVQQATVQRILELAKEHNLTINALAEKAVWQTAPFA